MDTTLRDGEQTSGVSFAAHEKLSIAQALLDLGVNRLEIASARVSDGEFEAVKRVASWAERTGHIQKIGRTVLKTLLNMSFKQSIRFVTCRSGVSCCLIRLAS